MERVRDVLLSEVASRFVRFGSRALRGEGSLATPSSVKPLYPDSNHTEPNLLLSSLSCRNSGLDSVPSTQVPSLAAEASAGSQISCPS